MTRKQIDQINRMFRRKAKRVLLVEGRFSMQQAVKFELVDEYGFLTFHGLEQSRRYA